MSFKEGLLLFWILAVMACCFFLAHFWSFALYALHKAVIVGIFPLLLFTKFFAGTAGLGLLA